MPTDPVTQAEIDAYIDGELCLDRRMAVEDHLARDPDAAARLMADLRACTALRLARQIEDGTPDVVQATARRLAQRLNRSPFRLLGVVSRGAIAAGVVAVLSLFLVPDRQVSAALPAYVADATMAYRTGLLRAEMPSQVETATLDEQDILRTTRIRLPRLPAGWRITDVQLFPSDQGPSLQVMVRTPDEDALSIFAVRASSQAPLNPIAVRHDTASVAYWREGDMSYALVGTDAPAALDIVADNLAAKG